jgi:hypothetical protein
MISIHLNLLHPKKVKGKMKVKHSLLALSMISFLGAGLLAWPVAGTTQVALAQIPPGFDAGNGIVWIEGDREEIFNRVSASTCPASPAPDEDTWLTVDSATLNATNARAAIVYGHAFASQDDVGEVNGITVFLAKGGTTPTPAPVNQLVHTLVNLAGEQGDEHSLMIIDLDENKDFNVLYRFGEISGPAADETQLCFWGMRIQLVGYILRVR